MYKYTENRNCLFNVGLTAYLEKNSFWQYYSSLEKSETSAFKLKDDIQAYWEITKDAWVFILVTLLNFTVTLVVFPGTTIQNEIN